MSLKPAAVAIFTVNVILIIAAVSLYLGAAVGPFFHNQAPTAISKDLADLPETSAIKQALLEKKRAEEKKQAEEKLFAEKRKREETARLLASQYSDLTFDYPDYLNKSAKGYPYYSQCLDKEKPIDLRGNYYLTRDCVRQSFILDRLSQNEALKKAFRLSKQAGLDIQLTDHFGFAVVYDRPVIYVNIDAADETIVNYLTKTAEVQKPMPGTSSLRNQCAWPDDSMGGSNPPCKR